ncbi:MAG: hypothetical protein MUE72_02670 [Chitinophagaceae bacterium]|jgi:hypothetical protein|nr:hypothetical protein [Chitinophagaceae bacterium]
MKSKFIFSVLVLLLLAISGLWKIQKDNNTELKLQIQSRDSLIKSSQSNDSLSCEQTQEYVKTITKYINDDCNIIIGTKKVSLSEFIDIYKNEVDKANSLSDSIIILKRQIEYINQRYSIRADTKKDGNLQITTLDAKQIDSALLLLKYFRDRLKFDSTNNSWLIRK